MARQRWVWDLIILVVVCCSTCGRSGAARDYADSLGADVGRRTVPPGASNASFERSDLKPCVIRTRWTFATSWDRARYTGWLRNQLAPQFTEIRATPRELLFARHADGDSHSLTIETEPGRDSMRVQVTFCVYPD